MRNVAYWSGLFVIFLMPWERLVKFPDLGTVSRFAGMVVALVWMLSVFSTGMRRPNAFHALLFVFVIWNALTLFWSVDAARTQVRIGAYVRMIGLSLIVWDLYRTSEAIGEVLQAYVLGAFIPAISTFGAFLSGQTHEYGRFSTLADNMNTTAVILALAVPLAVFLAISPPGRLDRRWLRMINAAYIPVGLFAICLTATRFALLMAIPALAFGFFTIMSRYRGAARLATFGLLVAALAGVYIFVPAASAERLATLDDELAQGDLNGRTTIWKFGMELWSDCPWHGVGSAAFHAAVMPFLNKRKSAHNSIVSILVETGAIGLALAGLLVVTAAIYAWNQPGGHVMFWMTVLIVWGLGNMPLTFFHTKSTWLLLSAVVTSSFAFAEDQRAAGDASAAGSLQPASAV